MDEFDYEAARARVTAADIAEARDTLPRWFTAWAGDYMEAESPPPTAQPDAIRARLDERELVVPNETPAVRGHGLLDRIKALVGRWLR